MSDQILPADVLDAAAAGFAEVAAEFQDLLGSAPTLAEFLELLGWAVPANSDATDGTLPQPLPFAVTLRGGGRYRTRAGSRVGELNDGLFVDLSDHAAALLDQMRADSGVPVTPQRFAAGVLAVLRTGRVEVADVTIEDIQDLVARVPARRAARPRIGDLVAIPARPTGYHLGVVLTRNRFGTALGLFAGTSPTGLLGEDQRRSPNRFPVYTGDDAVKAGTWQVTGHDERLLDLFPGDPEIYHRPDAWRSVGIDTGEFGAAESADNPTLRLIDAGEAAAAGLTDDRYRSVYLPTELQRRLDEGTVPG